MSRLRFRLLLTFGILVILLGFMLALASAQAEPATSTPTPTPIFGPYDAPLVGLAPGYNQGFEGSYTYPTDPIPQQDFPWTDSLDGSPMTIENSGNYISIVKDYIKSDMIALLSDTRQADSPSTWDPAMAGWYNEPWLSNLRDGIHGVYLGSSCFSNALFPELGPNNYFSTYVLVFYNDIAARSLYRVWGNNNALSPQLLDTSGANNAQFDEGSIIIKAAFSTATSEQWVPMTGALSWNIYTPKTDCPSQVTESNPSNFAVNFFQFDIIVKDKVAAPATTWVFSTLSYDKDIQADPSLSPAEQAWSQMSTLGVMWGNDPKTDPSQPLQENWINPNAPAYAKETLGWRGALSGANDGAVQNPPYYICTGVGCDPTAPCSDPSLCTFVDVGGPNLANSSCMSCHGAAQYAMPSFLIPAVTKDPQSDGSPNILIYKPTGTAPGPLYYATGSNEWMNWFQDRSPVQPQDPNNPYVIVATDYDMNLPFKVLPQWASQVCLNASNVRYYNPKEPTCVKLQPLSANPVVGETTYQGFPVPGG